MIRAKLWKGQDLKGDWEITIKVDGVRMLRDPEGRPVSRAGKPLYNLDHVPAHITDAEIFHKDWETSVSLVRSSVNGSPVPLEYVYSLSPVDKRLCDGYFTDPTVKEIKSHLNCCLSDNVEGLILRQGDKWLKVKPKETADVVVTGIQPGTGKHEGRMGALITNYGKIGTGFTDQQREELNSPSVVGQLIEVEYMMMTPGNKFRHPRFVRVRTDKTEESIG